MAGRSRLGGRAVVVLFAALLLVTQAFAPVAAQGAAIEADNSLANGIAAGEVKDPYATGRAIVTVRNLRRFWVAIEPADQWGSMIFEPAPTNGPQADLGGIWATIAVIPPLGTVAYDLSVDPRAGGGQAFRVHYDGTSIGGLAATALNIVQLVGYALGEAQLKGGAEAASMAIRALTQLPEWEDIVRKNQGDAMAITDLPAVVKALLGSETGRKALRQALEAVGIDVGLPALRRIATGVTGAEALLFLKDLGEAVGEGQVDGSVSFYAVLPSVHPSPVVGRFTSIEPLQEARAFHAGTWLEGGAVLFWGGETSSDVAPNVTAMASIEENIFGAGTTELGYMLRARSRHTVTPLPDDRYLIAGGVVGVATSEVFDLRSVTSRAVPMLEARLGAVATLLADGRVLIVGGLHMSGAVLMAELYDPATDAWRAAGPMEHVYDLSPTATLLGDGRVLIAGGMTRVDDFQRPTDAAELYDPRTDTFIATGSMLVARRGHSATLLSDGRVLIAGGATIRGSQASGVLESVADAEVYDPSSGEFASVGRLVDRRSYHTATLLGDGSVLIAGGEQMHMDWNLGTGGMDNHQTTVTLRSVEIYDPATGTFEATAPMSVSRVGHTATPIPGGRVVIAGGNDFRLTYDDESGESRSVTTQTAVEVFER